MEETYLWWQKVTKELCHHLTDRNIKQAMSVMLYLFLLLYCKGCSSTQSYFIQFSFQKVACISFYSLFGDWAGNRMNFGNTLMNFQVLVCIMWIFGRKAFMEATKQVKEPESKTYEEWLRELSSFWRRGGWGKTLSLYNYLKGGYSEVGVCLFSGGNW